MSAFFECRCCLWCNIRYGYEEIYLDSMWKVVLDRISVSVIMEKFEHALNKINVH